MTEPTVWPQSPYATIRWRLAKVSADGPDPDEYPDWTPDVGTEVTLRPSINGLLVYDDGSQKITIRLEQVKCVIDADGYLVKPGEDGRRVRIAATDDPHMSRTGWTWTAQLAGGSVVFAAPAGGVVELSDYVLAPAVDQTKVWVERIPELIATIDGAGTTAVDAADRAETAEQGAGVARVGAEAARDQTEVISGLTGEDQAVAHLLATTTSDARAALDVATAAALRGEPGRSHRAVFGAIRNVSGPAFFETIQDSAHRPSFITHVETLTDRIRLHYPPTTKVGAMVVVPDEAFAARGYTCGTSVGLSYADVSVYRSWNYSGYVSYNGSEWVSNYDVFTPTWNAGTLTLTHPPLSGVVSSLSANVTTRGGHYVCNLDGVSTTSLTVQFRDWSGNLVTTPTTSMRCYVSHGDLRPGAVNPQLLTSALIPASNFWLFGVFESA